MATQIFRPSISDAMGLQANAPKRGMDDYVLTLDGVSEQGLNVQGDFFHVLSANSTVLLRFNEGRQILRNQGQGGRVLYTKVGVFAAAAQTITLALGYGYATDSRATFNGTITAPVTPAVNTVPLATVSAGAGAQSLLAAADANRIELALQVDSAAPGGVFIGDNTTANEQGFFLEPGDKAIWSAQSALYAWNPNAALVKVRMTSLRKI